MGASRLTRPGLPPVSSRRLRTFSSCAALGAGPQLSVIWRHSVRRRPRPIRASGVDAALGNRIARAGVWPNGTASGLVDSSAWTSSTVKPSQPHWTCSRRTTARPVPTLLAVYPDPVGPLGRDRGLHEASRYMRGRSPAKLCVSDIAATSQHGRQPSSVSVGRAHRTVKTAP